jgi:hypothetical protein
VLGIECEPHSKIRPGRLSRDKSIQIRESISLIGLEGVRLLSALHVWNAPLVKGFEIRHVAEIMAHCKRCIFQGLEGQKVQPQRLMVEDGQDVLVSNEKRLRTN